MNEENNQTIAQMILQILERHHGDAINAKQIRDEMMEFNPKAAASGSIFRRLTEMYQDGWVKRYRTGSGRFVYRCLVEDESFAMTEEEIKYNASRSEKESEALTKHRLRVTANHTQIGEEFRVKTTEDSTRWLKVIGKTPFLCVFEGNKSCQWWDVYMYRKGALDCVG